jgi:hypothetical protein
VLLNWEGATGVATTQNIEQRQTAVRISTGCTERVECPIALGEQVRRPAPDRRLRDTDRVHVAATVSAGVEETACVVDQHLCGAGPGPCFTSTGCCGAFSPAHWPDGPLSLVAEITPLRSGDVVWVSAMATEIETCPR